MGTRLDFAAMALDRFESAQLISLGAIDRVASQAALQKSALLAEVGLNPDRFASAEASLGVRTAEAPRAGIRSRRGAGRA